MTIYKINKKHEEKLYNVLYSEIKYAANKCCLEDKCEKNIKLRELYEKNSICIRSLYDMGRYYDYECPEKSGWSDEGREFGNR